MVQTTIPNKAIVDIRLLPRCAIPPPRSQPICRIACAENFQNTICACLAYPFWRLNDPFCGDAAVTVAAKTANSFECPDNPQQLPLPSVAGRQAGETTCRSSRLTASTSIPHCGRPNVMDDDTWNQSMVQQLMRDGNMRRRLRNASPIGLIAKTTCRLRRTRSVKKLYIANGVASILRPYTTHVALHYTYLVNGSLWHLLTSTFHCLSQVLSLSTFRFLFTQIT